MNKLLKVIFAASAVVAASASAQTMTEYMAKIEQAEKKMKEIETFIENNFQGKERLCIWNRYINNDTYKQIGAEIYYTSSYTRKFITNAIYKYLETINK